MWIVGKEDGWTEGWVDGCLEGCPDGCVDGWPEGEDGWLDGCPINDDRNYGAILNHNADNIVYHDNEERSNLIDVNEEWN